MAMQPSWIDVAALKKAFSPSVAARSLLVAIVVGSVLNIINQGTEVAGGKPIDIPKLLLTYAVPFLVASFGAYSAYRQPHAPNETGK
jgi:hypothetical protein